MNPVLKRELVVRWRGHAVWLMFAVIALLALVVVGTYANESAQQLSYGDQGAQLSRVGRDLFQNLAFLQVLGWILLAPSLRATSISGERERGLLDALRLSHLSAARIVWGKLGAALFFVLQIALGVLPLISICFLMGGVAPAEFALAAWLQLVTALFGLCSGLYFSAINKRSSGAIVATLSFTLAWFFSSVFAAISADFASRASGNWATPIYKPLWLFGVTNPFFLTAISLQPSSRMTSPFVFTPAWAIGTFLQLALSALMIFGAIRAVRRPLETRVRAEAEKPRRRFFSRQKTATQAPRESSRPQNARLHWHLLPHNWTRKLNPLLRRELHARLRFSNLRGAWFWCVSLGALGLLFLFGVLWREVWRGETDAEDVWNFTLIFGTIGLALAATVIGALGLSRERENGTWEMLQLSLLSPGEVLRAKFFPIIFACGVYSLALWPLLLLGAWPTLYAWFMLGVLNLASALDVAQILSSLCVSAASAVVCAAWGLCVSWRMPKVASAVAWAVGGVFMLFGVAPFLCIMLQRSGEKWLLPWHPLAVLNDLFAYRYNGSQQSIVVDNAIVCCALWLGASAFLLLFLYRALRHALGATKRRAASTRVLPTPHK